jgi:predicted phage tail protein
MAFEKVTSKFLNIFARVFGVLCLLAAVVFLLSAAADSGNRGLFIVLGLGLLIGGVALLRVKRLTPADIDRFRSIGK